VREPFVDALVGQDSINKTAGHGLNGRPAAQAIEKGFFQFPSLSERHASQQKGNEQT
jgi:hypothetical protein